MCNPVSVLKTKALINSFLRKRKHERLQDHLLLAAKRIWILFHEVSHYVWECLGKGQINLRIFPYSTKHQLCDFGHVSHLPPISQQHRVGQSICYTPEETALGRWGDRWWPSPLPQGSVTRDWTSYRRSQELRQKATVGS